MRGRYSFVRYRMAEELDVSVIQEAIRKRYTEVACSAADKFGYPTGRAGAVGFGDDAVLLKGLLDTVLESFCGVGNPFSLGAIHSGEVVLDVGCGGGFDVMVASRLVGPTGRVYGIDMTPEMVERAQTNLQQVGVCNAKGVLACAEAMPYAAHRFDVVLSNGVRNLSPLKMQSFRAIVSTPFISSC
jgi:2-polyprenyl-3-methyl-5-hydroxy-6-metoxy-1,4-benzoquinol methylase